MVDDRAMAKTRPNSSESQAGNDGISSVGTSPLSDPDMLSASHSLHERKEFIMMPPEGKLEHFNRQAQDHEDHQEFDACIQDLVRCVALTRLVYEEGHLKLAQAHVRLAKAYFHFKGWGLQAQEHLDLARQLLPFCTSISSGTSEKREILMCLLSVHLTQGEAESSFLEAERVLGELHQLAGIDREGKITTELEICNGLSRVYKRQNRPEEASSQCERSLQLLKDCGKPEKMCSVYKDMAAIEQDNGHLDQAAEYLTKAHAIAMSHSLEELQGAHISHSLALILSAAEPPHNDSAQHHFEQSLSAYKKSAGSQDPTFLAVQDDYCRFLLFSGQQERCVEIQRASLSSKRSTFGDLSAEVADTLQLIGSVEMTKGRMKQAHRNMTKCLEIQTLLYGPQHKKTKTTQKAVDMLARAPEVAERHQRQGRKSTKDAPTSHDDGNSMSES
ncbi:tetratricopeptide repeat protein 23 isoform X1 [Xyrichtys novacula]|uniref:Tetratricopeptide repeat protein 23 isoform X1 n=1 Tax=Xyrichtys novacula TaxID=13765 RepID=A0AAV1F7D3_XYRNO|nr:tetratricopeptide repeat protein 23 isoform X1 [Xyrichtys novacula]